MMIIVCTLVISVYRIDESNGMNFQHYEQFSGEKLFLTIWRENGET